MYQNTPINQWGALMFGAHCLKTWSSTQSVIALSSGEAEFYGIVKGAAVVLGAVSLAQDLGLALKARVHTDSSAAKGIVSRRGLGKVRHIHTQFLWVQERLAAGDFSIHKEKTDDNVGDLMTKHLTADKLQRFMAKLDCRSTSGQDDLTLRAA